VEIQRTVLCAISYTRRFISYVLIHHTIIYILCVSAVLESTSCKCRLQPIHIDRNRRTIFKDKWRH